MLAAAIAAATSRLRIALAAIIAPLRHPLLLAKQLATLDLVAEGRLVVQPTVSWAADEYAALGVPFTRRGAILDEQLEAMRAAWTETPAAFTGVHFRFADVYCEPKPHRPGGPAMWFGGQTLHPALCRRIVRYGSGFHPFGTPTDADLERLAAAMAAAGRDIAELELVGGIRGRFTGPTGSPTWTRRSAASPTRSGAASPRSASSRRCSPTIRGAVPDICRRVVASIAAAA